jgi:hypothetical protein
MTGRGKLPQDRSCARPLDLFQRRSVVEVSFVRAKKSPGSRES